MNLESTPPNIGYSTAATSQPRLIAIYVCAALLILGGLLECLDAAVTAGNFHTTYERPTDRPLFWTELAGGGAVLLAAVALLLWKRLAWSVSLITVLVAAAVQVLPIHATHAAIADAMTRGGDTGSLSALWYDLSLLIEWGLVGFCLLSATYLCFARLRQ